LKTLKKYLQKNIETLEKSYWGVPTDETHLITRCCELRKKKLQDFTIEDLRIMIGQEISLAYLLPIAIEKLKENPLAAGNYFEGDLLENVLSIKKYFWSKNKAYWLEMNEIVQLLSLEEIEHISKDMRFKVTQFQECKWNKK
jgi:CDI immunity proteins